MGKKRNVDAESHLLTGGLITGFLTFMGFLPGAAASAAVTGSLVHKDIQKAKKQEAFQKDFALHQERTEKGRAELEIEIRRISKLLDYLKKYDFDPNAEHIVNQEKLEKIFYDASTRDSVYRLYQDEKGRKNVSLNKMVELASKAKAEDKIVELDKFTTEPTEFIVKTGGEEVYTSLNKWSRIPYNLRRQCNELGVAFKKHNYDELEKEKARIVQELYRPFQFDYSKYR